MLSSLTGSVLFGAHIASRQKPMLLETPIRRMQTENTDMIYRTMTDTTLPVFLMQSAEKIEVWVSDFISDVLRA